jgi:rod shape determining protein RodA
MRSTFKLILIGGYILLGIIGLVMLTSIAPNSFTQQALILLVGLLIMFYLANQDSGIFDQFHLPIYITSLLLLISTFILGEVVRGSVRWIDIGGFRLQPSELVKPLLIAAFAGFLTRFPPHNLKNIAINILTYLLPTLLIFRQPDLGTALVISAIWGTMIFVAGLPYLILGLGGIFLGVATYLSPRFLHDYQLNRLKTFFDPYQDPLGSGYNVIQAIIAVGSGKIMGKGLGHGTQSHFRFLPERHTDFMFASLAEELGLVGAGGVVVIMAFLLYALLSAMLKETSPYKQLMLTGVFGYLLFQASINIGMNLGIAPVTGVTLPLISYGGSSVLATSLIFGLALTSAKQTGPSHVLEIK